VLNNELKIDVVIPVYNDEGCLVTTLQAISHQNLKPNWKLSIYVIDDGSSVPVKLDAQFSDVSLIRLDKNMGASVARNTGASAGDGDALLFLDADCSLKYDQVLSLLLDQCIKGFDVCFGQIDVEGKGFWAEYQKEIAQKRATRFKDGDHSSMSTAIFLVKREVFELAGGFDEAYHFGFEDRDLFIALLKREARACLVEEALVNHNDEISLTSVTRKLFKSGATSSVRFIQKHPDEYEKMEYVKADVLYSKGGLKLLAFLSKPFLWPMVNLLDAVLKKEWLLFDLAKILVKYTSGLAYLQGTYTREK